ncbi:hypothetical protein V8G54_011848 [Vigna mungo]|uniref:Uncharacterized protein n=1 Tax=Vigna mungo TaxID=3915 RepID=A0AAQ3S1M4_VIGMU
MFPTVHPNTKLNTSRNPSGETFIPFYLVPSPIPLGRRDSSFPPPLEDEEIHLSTISQEERQRDPPFYPLEIGKVATFLPPHKRKGDYLSTPSKEERYNLGLTKYSQKTILKTYPPSHHMVGSTP